MQSNPRYFRRYLYTSFLAPIAVFVFVNLAIAQNQIPKAKIVLFTPSDIEAPPLDTYWPRLHRHGTYAEQFFHDGMKAWGYQPKRSKIFERDEKGRIPVLHVTGDLSYAGGKYKEQWISRQVYKQLRQQHNEKTEGNLYWIFVYVGDPPAKHDSYRGAGNSKSGGWAALNYVNVEGKISLKQPMVSRFHDEIFLKGSIHEFGHAFGLPHIGPKIELRRGNTLMGPVTRIYAQHKMPKQTQAYLSEFSAAVLSQHPLFSGDTSNRDKLPSTQFADTNVDYSLAKRSVVVSGRLKSNHEVHRVLLIDDRDDKPGAYWVKGYVAKADKNGEFKFKIPRPRVCKGTLKLLAVYTNGAFTGNGKKHGDQSALEVPYNFR